MKLKLIAVAGLLATQAYAQSSITAYGVVDLGYVKGTGDMANWSGLASGRNMSSRLGFKGEEGQFHTGGRYRRQHRNGCDHAVRWLVIDR